MPRRDDFKEGEMRTQTKVAISRRSSHRMVCATENLQMHPFFCFEAGGHPNSIFCDASPRD